MFGKELVPKLDEFLAWAHAGNQTIILNVHIIDNIAFDWLRSDRFVVRGWISNEKQAQRQNSYDVVVP